MIYCGSCGGENIEADRFCVTCGAALRTPTPPDARSADNDDGATRLESDPNTVHRDVKPENVLLVGGDLAHPKLADFGIAKTLEGETLTRTAMALGTPEYVAPEQARDAANVDRLLQPRPVDRPETAAVVKAVLEVLSTTPEAKTAAESTPESSHGRTPVEFLPNDQPHWGPRLPRSHLVRPNPSFGSLPGLRSPPLDLRDLAA